MSTSFPYRRRYYRYYCYRHKWIALLSTYYLEIVFFNSNLSALKINNNVKIAYEILDQFLYLTYFLIQVLVSVKSAL